MSDDGLLVLALVVTVLGMASFALSITAHWRQLVPQRPQSQSLQIGLRVVGAALLAVSLLICTAADPFLMAILVWPMLLLVAAGLVAAGFTLHAQTRRTTAGE